ncbi:MAG: nucleoside triphosphate pyrophosphatase [Sphingomonadaceae bacterium]
MLLLASTSQSRMAMLRAAGVGFESVAPRVDEEAVKEALAGRPVREIADRLAEMKAVKVSQSHRDRWVLGSDSMMALSAREYFDKPGTVENLRAQLQAMRGREHRLVSAAVIARDGQPVWRHVEDARLAVRNFSDAWLESYIAASGDAIFGSAGGYHVEGLGAQLFTRIDGDQFVVRGLPLLAVLGWLRESGEMLI